MRSLSLSPFVCLHAAKLKANFISSWYMLIWKSRCLKCYIGLWISLVNSQRKSVNEITLTKENIFNLSFWDHTKLLENSYIPNERKKYPTKNCVYHIFISQFRGSGDCRRLFIQIIGYKFVPSKKKKRSNNNNNCDVEHFFASVSSHSPNMIISKWCTPSECGITHQWTIYDIAAEAKEEYS